MQELSLFSGAGGGLLATKHLLGFNCVGYVEKDSYCQRVLRARIADGYLDDAPIFDDVRTFDGLPYRGKVDIVTAGFPCQPYSTAVSSGARALCLWGEVARIVEEVQPGAVFAENVARRAIERAAEDCISLGYSVKAIAVSAADLGADHVRQRYWLFAYTDNESELLLRLNAEVAGMSNLQARVWNTYTEQSGMVDGLANRVDRLRAIGNGQVPIVAATAFRELLTPTPASEERK